MTIIVSRLSYLFPSFCKFFDRRRERCIKSTRPVIWPLAGQWSSGRALPFGVEPRLFPERFTACGPSCDFLYPIERSLALIPWGTLHGGTFLFLFPPSPVVALLFPLSRSFSFPFPGRDLFSPSGPDVFPPKEILESCYLLPSAIVRGKDCSALSPVAPFRGRRVFAFIRCPRALVVWSFFCSRVIVWADVCRRAAFFF